MPQKCMSQGDNSNALSFSGISCHLLAYGLDLPVSRRQVLTSIIKRHGGAVLEFINDKNINDLTHIFVSARLAADVREEGLGKNMPRMQSISQLVNRILQSPRPEKLKAIKWLDATYIVDCLTNKKILPEGNYDVSREFKLALEDVRTLSQSEPSADEGLGLVVASTSSEGTLSEADSPLIKDPASDNLPMAPEVPGGDSSADDHQAGRMSSSSEARENASRTRSQSDPSSSAINHKRLTRYQRRVLKNRGGFGCQRRPLPKPDKNNEAIAVIFDELAETYGAMKGEPWRSRAYRMAATALRRLPFPISSPEDLQRPECRALGQKTKDKIKEYLSTGTISKADHLQKDERLCAIKEFYRIWGVAGSTGEKWFNMGLRNLDDIRRRPELLNHNQRIGLKYVDELTEKMPRAEAAEIVERVATACEELFTREGITVVGAGSFRRGKAFCGDVDIILCRTDDEKPTNELILLVQKLRANHFLTDDLQGDDTIRSDSGVVRRTYMGICQLNSSSKHRRIDIKIYQRSCFALALLYFTGSAYFVRSLRLFAKKMGFTMSDTQLVPVMRTRSEKVVAGTPVVCRTEREVFEALELEYREPWEREVDEIDPQAMKRALVHHRTESELFGPVKRLREK